MKDINSVLSKLTSIEDERYISLKDCLVNKDLEKYQIPICFGRDSNGEIVIKDLTKIGNLIVSGMTTSGKSVFLNSVINTILLTKDPKEVQLLLIDFKRAEFHTYENISHLEYKVIYDVEEAVYVISNLYNEREKMERGSYPDIVVIIDDYADFLLLEGIRSNVFQDLRHWMMHILVNGNNLGIYTILSSSMISDNIFLTNIRNRVPNRLVGFIPTSQDSLTILGEKGAEDLLGKGDMIYRDIKKNERVRVQVPFISSEDQELVVNSVPKTTRFRELDIEKIEEETDPLYEDAKKLTIESRKASASFLQRKLVISYIRASTLIDELEKEGVIGAQKGSKPREILIDRY